MDQGNFVLSFTGGSDMSSTLTSQAIDLSHKWGASLQCNWSGGSAVVGTFKLQASDDPADGSLVVSQNIPTNWADVSGSSQAISGTPGSILFDIVTLSYKWVRVVYTPTSGGTSVLLSGNIQVKG